MATLGQKPATTHVSFQKQTITGNGGTSYTLQQSVGSELDIAVFINNTRQEPTTAYTASGTTLVMTGVVNSSDHFYVIFLAKAINTTGLPLSAVNTDNINASAVTDAKIAGVAASKLTGTIASARLPSGSILQVLTATDSTERQTTSNSFVTASNTLVIQITPSSASNKIFVTCSLSYITPGSTYSFFPTIYRNSTNLGASNGFGNLFSGSSYNYGHATLQILDSPNTTSQVTYQPYIKVGANAGVGGINGTNTFSSITAFEVAG